jgi:hypothetical protein
MFPFLHFEEGRRPMPVGLLIESIPVARSQKPGSFIRHTPPLVAFGVDELQDDSLGQSPPLAFRRATVVLGEGTLKKPNGRMCRRLGNRYREHRTTFGYVVYPELFFVFHHLGFSVLWMRLQQHPVSFSPPSLSQGVQSTLRGHLRSFAPLEDRRWTLKKNGGQVLGGGAGAIARSMTPAKGGWRASCCMAGGGEP